MKKHITFDKDCMLMIHINYKKGINMLLTLYHEGLLDSISVEIDPPHTACSSVDNGVVQEPNKLCIKMYNRSYCPDYSRDIAVLVAELYKYTGEGVTVKQNDTGYSVDDHEHILNEWPLREGGE